VLPFVLLALGAFFIILGVTKKTGFAESYPELNPSIAAMFFIYGFFQITFAIFLFNAPTPYGNITTETINYTYYPENLTVNSYDSTGLYQGMENRTVEIVNSTTTSYVYSTSEGPDVANLFFYINIFLFTVYLIFWGIMFLKALVTKGKQ
jgi:hypothetical protein